MTPEKSSGAGWKRYILPVAAIVLVALILQLFYSRREGRFTELRPRDGVLDVTAVDLSSQVYNVVNNWDYFPNRLYGHGDFAAGVPEKPVQAGKDVSTDTVPFGTYRLLLKTRPGQACAICGFSIDYATRVYVNGVEVAAFGRVADTAAGSVPGGGYMTVPVAADDTGTAEIIYQYANFVHKEGGFIPPIYLSTPQNIENFKAGNTLVSVGISGAMLILALYFLLFAAVQKQQAYLCIAFCCLVMSLRDNLFWGSFLLPADTSWYVIYRTSLVVSALLPMAFLLLLRSFYSLGKRPATAFYILAIVADILLMLLSDTKKSVLFCTLSYILSVPYALYMLYCVAAYFIRRKKCRFPDGLFLTGCGILLGALLTDALLSGKSSFATRFGFAPTGMLIFILLTAIAASLRVQQQQMALEESRRRSRILEKMNSMNLDFLHNVAHELKTPLTVISGYAQLTGLQLATDNINEETPENLKTIQQEASRLADMVTQLMEYSYGKQSNPEFHDVFVPELLKNAQAICVPMCMKNGNAVTVAADEGYVHGNGEMLLQIFINLAANANRHTRRGTVAITASAGEEPGFTVFRVTDTGDGIPAEHLPHIFEKGYSGDGSSGLGLAICAEAVEAHGGSIQIEKTGTDGTTVRFTVPKGEQSQ